MARAVIGGVESRDTCCDWLVRVMTHVLRLVGESHVGRAVILVSL